jgi:hypothetical protein
MIARGDTLDPTLARTVTVLAAVIAVALAVALPTAYFVSSRAVGNAAIEAEANVAAVSVSQLASRNPDLWVFENVRLLGLLAMLGPPPASEQREVFQPMAG